jgi:hypothetical protein
MKYIYFSSIQPCAAFIPLTGIWWNSPFKKVKNFPPNSTSFRFMLLQSDEITPLKKQRMFKYNYFPYSRSPSLGWRVFKNIYFNSLFRRSFIFVAIKPL